jgi:hypothetical protein
MVLNRMRIRVTTLVLMMMMFDEEDGRAGRRERVLSRKRVGRVPCLRPRNARTKVAVESSK